MFRLNFTQKCLPFVYLLVILNCGVAQGLSFETTTREDDAVNKTEALIGRQIGKNMSKILDSILEGYDARLRPFPKNDPSQPTVIDVDLNIRSMGPISEIDRSYSMDCYFRQTWNDPRLVYNGPSNREIAVHIAMLEKLWKPDTYFYNGKDSYIHMITTANKLLRISPEGTIFYSMRLTIKADCPMDLEAYPMDTQNCPLTILSFAHGANLIRYNWKYGDNQSIVVNDDVKLSQFDIASYTHVNGSFRINNMTHSTLHVTFKLQRHMGYFLLQVYIPSILLVSMSWVTFWLNREATSDRVGLGITVILTLTTMSRGNDQDLPQVPYATALELYVQMCFTFLILSMFEFVGVHYFTKHGGGDYHNIEPESDDEHCNEPTEEELLKWKAERKLEKARRDSISAEEHLARAFKINPQLRKRMKKSKLAQGIGMISLGTRYKEVSFWHKLLSCLKGSHKYRDSMRRRARRAGHLANSVSRLDKISRVLFPLTFIIINIIYWTVYYYNGVIMSK